MKQFLKFFALLILPLCYCGCLVQALNPFYTENTVIECPIKLGSWDMIDDKGEPKAAKPWLFEKEQITVYDENGASGVLKVVYFKLENTLFLDATVADPDQTVCKWWLMNMTPVHTVCRIKMQDKNLTIEPINFEAISNAVENKTFNLPYIEKKDWDAFLITASSQELVAFLNQNKQNNELFSDTYAMKFVMKSGLSRP